MKPRLEVADVFREHGAQLLSRTRHAATFEQLKVIRDILLCGTAALGGHLYQCGDCKREIPSYNSCRNRHCPRCQGSKAAQWVLDRAKDLLPVPYFHTVFTLPNDFNPIVLRNRRVMYEVLFQAVKDTILTVGKNNFNCELGFFSVLHTWGQLLQLHPHIHCVIPGVGLLPDGGVHLFKDNYFLPDKVLSEVFRGKFICFLKRAYAAGKLELKGELEFLKDETEFEQFLNCTVRSSWVVKSKPPFAGPQGVLKYLARYTHRVAISNRRLVALKGGKVSLSYRDYKDESKTKVTSLDAVEFLRRFLLHILPKAFVRVRYFGFLANGRRKKSLAIIRTVLRAAPVLEAVIKPHSHCCPGCGSSNLSIIREIRVQTFNFHAPPYLTTGTLVSLSH